MTSDPNSSKERKETSDNSTKKPVGLFAKLDQDGDGVVTEDEIKAATAMQDKSGGGSAARVSMNRALTSNLMGLLQQADISKDLQPQAQVSPLFTKAMATVIVINAIVLGCEAQFHGSHAKQLWIVLNHIFTVIYLLEAIIKLAKRRLLYFTMGWNLLDFALTVASIVEMWILTHIDSASSSGYNVQGVLRLARLIRVIRVLKLQPDLTMVIEGIIGSMASIAWITLLLSGAIYVVAIACTFIIGTQTYPPVTEDDLMLFLTFDNKEYFGSLIKSMLTMFNVAILTEWPEIVRPMIKRQPYAIPFLVVIMMFLAFGILNVIIGVVVRNTEDVRRAEIEMNETKKKRRKLELVHSIWNSGGLSGSADLQQILEEMDLPLGFNMPYLCRILDSDGSGNLEREEFEFGLCRLITGNNNAFHQTCIIMNNLALIRKDVMTAIGGLHTKVDALQNSVDDLTKLSGTVHDLEKIIDYMVRREALL